MNENSKLYLVADGINDATDVLQEMLDKRGDVYIPSGTYSISRSLIIYSDTRLTLAPDATIRVADGAKCSILDNEGLRTHIRSHDITIIGGRWDGNHENQSREELGADEEFSEDKYISNTLLCLLMRFVHVDRLTLRDMVIINPTTFGAHIADATYFTVENIHLQYNLSLPNMDGIHIQGPARFGVIRNIYGAGNDDQVALTTDATARTEITKGVIEDITIDGVYSENGYTGVRLLSCGTPLRNVKISNICGTYRYYAVSFTHHYKLKKDTKVMLENVSVSNLRVSKAENHKWIDIDGPLVWFESNITCRNIAIENIFRRETNHETKAPLIGIDENVDITNLRVRNLFQIFESGEGCPAFVTHSELKNSYLDETCK